MKTIFTAILVVLTSLPIFNFQIDNLEAQIVPPHMKIPPVRLLSWDLWQTRRELIRCSSKVLNSPD